MSNSITIDEIILASASSFRAQLLESTGLKFSALRSPVSEYQVKGDTPTDTALARARTKAQGLVPLSPRSVIIGADQVLELEGKSFDKVTTKAEAKDRLTELSGKTHRLRSAYTILVTGERQGSDVPVLFSTESCVSANMTLRELEEAEIDAYLENFYEWESVVGCYMYEKAGIALFEKIDGDHSIIIGLPLLSLLADLRSIGLNHLLHPTGPWELPADLPGWA